MKKLKILMLIGACTLLCTAFYPTPAFSQGSQNGDDGGIPSLTLPQSGVGGPKAARPKAEEPEPLVKVTILPTSGTSVNSPSYAGSAGNKENIMFGINGFSVITDRSLTPAAWHELSNGFLEWGDMVLSGISGFYLWLGMENPSGLFANERGNRIKWCVIIESTNGVPFSGNQVWFDVKSSQPIFNLVGNLATNTAFNGSGGHDEIPYQFILQGYYYGPDGVPGGGGEAAYNTDAGAVHSTTLVHKLVYIGVTTAYSANNSADLAADKNDALQAGFTNTIRYYLKVGSHTNGIATATVGTGPQLSIRKSGSDVVVTVLGQPGVGYTLQHAFSLGHPPTPPAWANISGTFFTGMTYTGPYTSDMEYFRLRSP